MEGEHLLDSKGLVQVVINNVDNLTLRGESGHSNTDIIIRCGSNTYGLEFNNGNINIYDIAITGCGQQDIMPLSFTSISLLYIHHIKIYNNILNSTSNSVAGALYIHSVSDITIINSTFINNKADGNGGGLSICPGTDAHNNITITNSAFTNNNNIFGKGGGLVIYNGYTSTNTHNNITIQ